MSKPSEKELTQILQRIELEKKAIQQEKQDLHEQRAQIIVDSEKIMEKQRQLQEQEKRIQEYRNARETTSNGGNNGSGGEAMRPMGTIGDVERFSINEDFQMWYEQFQQFLKSNGLSEARAVSLFIMKMDKEAYKLLRSLCAPDLPGEKELGELVSLIQNHLKPKASARTQRYKFKECKQMPGQSVTTYLAELKKISLHCEFGSNLENHLLDQFVWGLRNEHMKKKLLYHPNLTMELAVGICTAMEAADQDIAGMWKENHNDTRGPQVNYLVKKAKARSTGWKGKTTCFCCGKPNHKAKDCRYKEYDCKKCGKKGHLIAVCRSNTSRGKVDARSQKNNSKNRKDKPVVERQKFLEDVDLAESFNNLYHVSDKKETIGVKPICT